MAVQVQGVGSVPATGSFADADGIVVLAADRTAT